MYQHYNPYTGQVLPGMGAYASPSAIEPDLFGANTGMGGFGDLGAGNCTISNYVEENQGFLIAAGLTILLIRFFMKKGYV